MMCGRRGWFGSGWYAGNDIGRVVVGFVPVTSAGPKRSESTIDRVAQRRRLTSRRLPIRPVELELLLIVWPLVRPLSEQTWSAREPDEVWVSDFAAPGKGRSGVRASWWRILLVLLFSRDLLR